MPVSAPSKPSAADPTTASSADPAAMTKLARPKSRALLAAGVLALSVQLTLAAEPASVSLYLFEQNSPLGGAQVEIDGVAQGSTSADGALQLRLEPGARLLRVLRDGVQLLQLQLDLAEQEDAELIATIHPDAAPSVFLESSHRQGGGALVAGETTPAGPPGELRGRIVNSEDGKPVAGARVFVSGLPVDIVTAADGSFSATLAAGSYSISVVAASYATQTLDGVEILAEGVTEKPIELTPAGLELPEFVVLEPYVEGSLAAFVEERRTSAAVTDILGAEQISRAGDSDAAGALKRVTGLTLVDGKFVYVRGLGERYSSVLLNGAQIPSPDPTRRVVPLDLFPTDILEGVVVQKTYSAEMPGEFGGGSIGLRTRGYPDGPLLRLSLGTGGSDGTTFEDGLTYAGGRRDWTGRDDGARELPAPLDALRRAGTNANSLPIAERVALGREVAAAGYATESDQLMPDGSLGISGGTSWQLGEDWKAGFLASTRFVRKFDQREETRRFFVASSSGVTERDAIEQSSTREQIEGGAFISAGLDYGEDHGVRGTSMLLRQSEDLTRFTEGTADSQLLRRYELQWVENELLAHQLAGEHRLPWFWDKLQFDWLYTRASASRYAPNLREYRYDYSDRLDQFLVSTNAGANNQRWEFLDDASESADLALRLPFAPVAWLQGSLGLFGGRLERERESSITRYQFTSRFPASQLNQVIGLQDPNLVFAPDNIRSNGWLLQQVFLPTDNYTAEQTLDYTGVALDLNLVDRFRINLGYREEDNLQITRTFSALQPGQPSIGQIDQTDRLPAAAFTWWLSQSQQLRLGYSKTVSRPDFRELSPAPYIDPILDTQTFGNPDLVTTEITNYDLRWEFYFSPTESVSVAAFRKEFANPIEKQLLPGSGSILLTLANAEAAVTQGVELDMFKQLTFLDRWLGDWAWSRTLRLDRPQWTNWYLAANYAWIDSEIQLDPTQSGFNTNLQRPLEGQSPYVINLQLGHASADGRREATLLYNIFGERIVQVGVDGAPDVYEQPFGQLDFNYRLKFGDAWSMRLRLRNLLDPKVELLQGGGVLREYTRGREIGLSIEWRPR